MRTIRNHHGEEVDARDAIDENATARLSRAGLVGDARKRQTEPRLFADVDAQDQLCIWERSGPQNAALVLKGGHVKDHRLLQAIVRMVEAGDVA